MCHTCPNKFEDTIRTKSFPIADVEQEDLLAVLPSAVEYVGMLVPLIDTSTYFNTLLQQEKSIKEGQDVFVHCKAGISRSGCTPGQIIYS